MRTVKAKTIVTKNKSNAWFGSEYTMNIYRGCCHGCIYCDSRSSCYRIDNFDEVTAKEDALRIIRNDLQKRRKIGIVATGSMSDPYNPFEEQELLTHNALKLLHAAGFGVTIATKSPLITRDIPVLSDIKKTAPVLAKITITAADDELCSKLEPNAPPSSARFKAVNDLSSSGIFCGILLMPVLPFVTDSEDNILRIVEEAALAGARFIYPSFGVTLRENQRDYFYKQLDSLLPDVKRRYIAAFGDKYVCTSPQAGALWKTFKAACDARGILYKMPDIISAYTSGYQKAQMSLF